MTLPMWDGHSCPSSSTWLLILFERASGTDPRVGRVCGLMEERRFRDSVATWDLRARKKPVGGPISRFLCEVGRAAARTTVEERRFSAA
jgi:hypothetical protein